MRGHGLIFSTDTTVNLLFLHSLCPHHTMKIGYTLTWKMNPAIALPNQNIKNSSIGPLPISPCLS